MWQELEVNNIQKIEKCVAEFQVWMNTILPFGKMKIKIYEDQDKTYTGCTDVRIKRKFDGEAESAVGYGKTIDEALEDTIKWFMEIIYSDYPIEEYPNGLSEEDIEYTEYSDF